MTRLPSTASATGMAQRSLRRLAKEAVNPGGICCVINVAGIHAANAVRSCSNASTPPVDAPMATILPAAPAAPLRYPCGGGRLDFGGQFSAHPKDAAFYISA